MNTLAGAAARAVRMRKIRAGRTIVSIGFLFAMIGFFLAPWAQASFLASISDSANSVTGMQMVLGELFSSPLLRQINDITNTPGLWPLLVPLGMLVALVLVWTAGLLKKFQIIAWFMALMGGLVSLVPLVIIILQDKLWVLTGNNAFVYHPLSQSGSGYFITALGMALVLLGAFTGGLIALFKPGRA